MLAVALHGELLQVGGEALEVLLVGQHRDGLRAEEVVVPERQQAHAARACCARTARCGNARPCHGSRRAWRGNCRGRRRPWSRGRSPNPWNSGRRPSPRSRTCCRCRCRTCAPRRRWSRPRRNAWRPRPCIATEAREQPQSRAVCALVMVSSVVKVFEETMNSVSAGSRSRDRFGEVGAVDVGDEAEGHRRGRCSAAAPRTP